MRKNISVFTLIIGLILLLDAYSATGDGLRTFKGKDLNGLPGATGKQGAAASGSPDLSLEKNTVSPSPITQGVSATLTVEVKNIGKAKNRAVVLFFHGDENALQAFGIPMYNSAEHGVPMPELAAGQVFTYTSTKAIKIPAGNYTVRAIIWPGNKPMAAPPMSNSESNLGNNEKEVQFTVKRASLKPSNLGPKHKIPANTSGQGVIP